MSLTLDIDQKSDGESMAEFFSEATSCMGELNVENLDWPIL